MLPKKSAWTRRKAEVLTESYEHGEVSPDKLEDPENFADPQTKYLTYKVWRRHLHYTQNLEGDPPERGEPIKKDKAKVAATTWVGEINKNDAMAKYKPRICVNGDKQSTDEPWGLQLD